MQTDVWTYRERSQLGTDVTRDFDLTGYGVEALDGSIGKVDEATYEVGSSLGREPGETEVTFVFLAAAAGLLLAAGVLSALWSPRFP